MATSCGQLPTIMFYKKSRKGLQYYEVRRVPPPPLRIHFFCLLACQRGWWCMRDTPPRVWKIDLKILTEKNTKKSDTFFLEGLKSSVFSSTGFCKKLQFFFLLFFSFFFTHLNIQIQNNVGTDWTKSMFTNMCRMTGTEQSVRLPLTGLICNMQVHLT